MNKIFKHIYDAFRMFWLLQATAIASLIDPQGIAELLLEGENGQGLIENKR